MRKIAIVGFKGGIGKTTTCVSLGAALALRGHRVLLIDTDTQANVAIALGISQYQKSLADVLIRKAKAEECIVPARPNLDMLPSSLALFKAQQRMVLEMAREEIFAELFAGLNGYEYLLMDCAPSVSLLTVNAMAYVDEVFIPVSMELLALAGAQQFLEYLKSINRMLGKGATIRLIIPTFFDPRRQVSPRVLAALEKTFGDRVTLPIRVDTKLSEAPGVGKTIFEYAPRSRGAVDYARLTELVATMPPLEQDKTE
ncbi:MAG: ParA family protein [Anaerolineae bacterium]|nr:ParA family protein [Anaerolineales bacterium]MCQ3972728.1 ParA family protein [Anaerolineae bacterium]